jgi:hypothetical protein
MKSGNSIGIASPTARVALFWALRLDRRLTLFDITAMMVAAALLLRAFSYTVTGLDWDESLYIVIAQRWLHGGVPYVTVWDQHPMGVPAVFAAASWLIGDGLLAARITGFCAVVGTALLLTIFLTRLAGERVAGILAGLFYLFIMSRPDGLAANTEVLNNLVITAASLILCGELLRTGTRIHAGRLFAASFLLGLGLQFKYVVFPEAATFCCIVLVHGWISANSLGRTVRLALLSMLGGLLPTLIATLYFWHVGALQAYLDANVRANVAYLDMGLTPYLLLMRLRFGVLPLIGLVAWLGLAPWLLRDAMARHRYARIGWWLFAWLVAASVDVALPMKFWKHYFNALIPPMCLIAGLSAVLLARRAGTWRRWVGVGLAVATILPAAGLMIRHVSDSRSISHPNVPRELARHIQQGGSDGHDIYVFNYDPLVYAYADATPPTRYTLGIELSEFSGSAGSRSVAEIRRVLDGEPRWIVVADPSPYGFTPRIWTMLSQQLSSYRLAASFDESDYVQAPITVRLYQRVADETGDPPIQTRTD